MKRLHLIIAIVAFIALLSSSCTVKPNTNLIFYKVNVVESNTKMIISNLEPKALDSIAYQVGDTVWVNTKTKRVDPTDSVGMKATIISMIGIDTEN